MNIAIEITKQGGTKETYKKCSYADLKLVALALCKGEIREFTATQKD